MSNKYSSWLFYNRFYNKGILFCKKKKKKKEKERTWRDVWPNIVTYT